MHTQAEADPRDLEPTLNDLYREVAGVHGPAALVTNRVGNAVKDFRAQATIWGAYEVWKDHGGTHPDRGWSVPTEFRQLFGDWMAAHRTLAEQAPQDAAGLTTAVERVVASTGTLLHPLYRAKETVGQ